MPRNRMPHTGVERTRPQSFNGRLRREGLAPLARRAPDTLQVNLGKLCNQACGHCHVEAGPGRKEVMQRPTVERLLELLSASPGIELVDVTGGAPEMNPHFRRLVTGSRLRGRRVTVRSNLTILVQPGRGDLVPFLAEHAVGIIASLPCYSAENVDRQRGAGAFDGSIRALRRLNEAGYGQPGSPLTLDLVYNPLGPTLPPLQEQLQDAYKERLGKDFGIVFNRLLTITNMPIKRFAWDLERQGRSEEYQRLLEASFNPGTVPGLMCRNLVSVSWDGRLYDCDFNQMLDLPLGGASPGRPRTVWELESLGDLAELPVGTGPHCFGCTAGAGSGCSGALA